ncbi:type II toxin-antitoxin system HigB family toxin [Persicobacter psychrovividus]|uniref:Toxin RelE n=1 Tax=Persicobacter psychrovividus TaxID=387638 RepID=A0ABM7VN56_9BACT|nr:toxin RelE [Persicobacter psychrovividus]
MVKTRNRIISDKVIREFLLKHPTAKHVFERWLFDAKRGIFKNFDDLQKTFRAPDKAGKNIVFNIGGNKYRLVADIRMTENRAIFYILFVGTHKAYDQIKAEEL